MQNSFNKVILNKNRISPTYEAMDLVDEAQMVNEIEGKSSIADLPLMRHKQGYKDKLTTTTNQASPSCPLPISKDTAPRLKVDEISRLAKAWCGLILGFIQERNRVNSSVPFSSLQGKIDIGKG